MPAIHFQEPQYFIFFCFLLALSYAFLLYYKSKFGINKPSKPAAWWAFALRFTAVFLIALFLLNPFSKLIEKEVEKPVLLWLQDNSSSLLLNDSTVSENISEIKKQAKEVLSKKYDIHNYRFGQSISDKADDFLDKETNISEALNFIENKYQNANLGAVVLSTDGIYNIGINPLYASNALNAPLFTLALGDSSKRKDALIADVVHNQKVYTGNSFPVVVKIAAKQLKNQTLNLSVWQNKKQISKKSFVASNQNFAVEETFFFEAEKEGVLEYTFRLEKVSGERILENNQQTIFIDVIDAQRKVLILAAHPHPDVAAIRASLERNSNYQLNVFWTESAEFQKEQNNINLSQYHLAILHNYPNTTAPEAFIKKLKEVNLPLFFISGNSTNFNILNRMNTGVQIITKSESGNQVQAAINENFNFFSLENRQSQKISSFPPLAAPFANISMQAPQVLLYQKIGNLNTKYPLLAFSIVDNKKVGLLSADGLWRWFIIDYKQHGTNALMDDLLQKSVQFLAAREDKRPFRLLTKKRIFNENEAITLNAELFDEAGNFYKDGIAEIKLRAEGQPEYKYSFGLNANFYTAQLGYLPPATYDYTAKAIIGSKEHQLSGKFIVKPVFLEQLNAEANYNLLYQLAEQYNGKMFTAPETKNLIEALEAQETFTLSREQMAISELINLKWLLFVLVGLLGLEWIIRKFNGVY